MNQKRHILYDCTAAQPTGSMKINGGGEYSIVLLSLLLERLDAALYDIHVCLSSQKGENIKLNRLLNNIFAVRYDDMKHLSKIIVDGLYDVIVFPIFYPAYSALKIRNDITVIGGIHDLSTLHYADLSVQPGQLYKSDGLNGLRWLWYVLGKRHHVIASIAAHKGLFTLSDNSCIYTVSNFTKSAIQYYLGKEISGVFYPPLKIKEYLSWGQEEEILQKYRVNAKRYILLTSGCRWAKNNYRALLAIDHLLQTGIIPNDFKVVICGCDSKHIRFYEASVSNRKHFFYYDYVDDIELEVLYKNAYMFIFPSLVEGFGSPPIEAMQYGTLCLCSTSTSITEICGDAVIYFDPFSVPSIEMAIMRAMDGSYAQRVSARIPSRVALLSELQQMDAKRLVDMIVRKAR